MASKIAGPNFDHIRDASAPITKENVRSAIEGSLKRLKTDYIDLYQIHWPTRTVNRWGKLDYDAEMANTEDFIEETLTFLSELVKEGKIRSIGVSNETAWGLHKFISLSNEKGLPRIASIQNPYNLIQRSYDVNTSEFTIREDISLLAYSPLAGGILTGKYLNNNFPDGARFSTWGKNRMPQYTAPKVESSIFKI